MASAEKAILNEGFEKRVPRRIFGFKKMEGGQG
jgi:hypothetical protein